MKPYPLYATQTNPDSIIIPIDLLETPCVDAFDSEEYYKARVSIMGGRIPEPIIVFVTSVAEWEDLAEEAADMLGPDDCGLRHVDNAPVFLVMKGNNLVAIAKEMGYNSIEGNVCQTKEEVRNWCK